jgi:hypothetical protein
MVFDSKMELAKNVLAKLKLSLHNDKFKRIELFFNRALDDNIVRFKYPFHIYREIQNLANSNENYSYVLSKLFTQALDGIVDYNKMRFNSLTEQEHILIGSTAPPKAQNSAHIPIGLVLDNSLINKIKIMNFRKNLFVEHTYFGQYFGYEYDGKQKFFYLLEDINKTELTTLTCPRLINIEKLENLIIHEPKAFETASLDDIYAECKMEFKYSLNFPFLRKNIKNLNKSDKI